MTRNFRFYYWLFKGFLTKHLKVLVLAVFGGALIFSQIPTVLPYLPKPKTTTYVGRVGSFTLANLPRDVQLKISHGLTEIDDSGRPIPALAEDWKIIDDGKTYVFTIREDAVWQDGSPVLAEEIDYTINDVVSEVVDDRTIVFRLEEPFSPFPAILSQPIFKRETVSYLQVVDRTKIVGTGQYELTRIRFSGNSLDHLVLESDDEKIVYRFYNTEAAAILAFKLAEIDVIEEISNIDEIEDWPNLTVETNLSKQQYAVVYFNVNDPNLTEKRIRQALNYMIPKNDDIDRRALGPISANSWVYNPSLKPYTYSFDSAQSLVQNLMMDFEIELTTTPKFFDLAEQIRASWEQLGPTVRIKVVNMPDTSDYQALLIGQQIPLDPDQYMLWHSTQADNITRFESPKIDKLLEDGRKELDEDLRKDIYMNFQRFIVEDTPAAFLHYLESFTVSRR